MKVSKPSAKPDRLCFHPGRGEGSVAHQRDCSPSKPAVSPSAQRPLKLKKRRKSETSRGEHSTAGPDGPAEKADRSSSGEHRRGQSLVRLRQSSRKSARCREPETLLGARTIKFGISGNATWAVFWIRGPPCMCWEKFTCHEIRGFLRAGGLTCRSEAEAVVFLPFLFVYEHSAGVFQSHWSSL